MQITKILFTILAARDAFNSFHCAHEMIGRYVIFFLSPASDKRLRLCEVSVVGRPGNNVLHTQNSGMSRHYHCLYHLWRFKVEIIVSNSLNVLVSKELHKYSGHVCWLIIIIFNFNFQLSKVRIHHRYQD